MIQTIGWSTALGLILVFAIYFQIIRIAQIMNDVDSEFLGEYWEDGSNQHVFLQLLFFPVLIVFSSTYALFAVVLNRNDRFSNSIEDLKFDLRLKRDEISRMESSGNQLLGGAVFSEEQEIIKHIRLQKVRRFLNYDLFLIINLSFLAGTALLLWSEPSLSPVQSWWTWLALLFVLQLQWVFSYVIGAFSLSVFLVKLVADVSEDLTASILLNFAVEVASSPTLVALLTLAFVQAVISAFVELLS